ncbi:MAG: TRAP transporter substrate-binding protein [Albidovulum sp.]|nr:TRAP transporter substrate-binding protein [Albidovulum sp.]
MKLFFGIVKEMKEMVASLSATAAAFAAAMLAFAGASVAQEFSFKLHHLLSANAPAHTQMLEPWAKQVEENSGGRVEIEIFPSMTLGGRPAELISQARDGVVDIVWTVNGYTPGLFPRTEVLELPFVYVNDPVAANLTLYDLFESDLKQEYAGVEVMYLHVHAGQAIHMRSNEVRSPADLAGLKMRIPTRTGAWIIEALGATPVAMPVPDLPQALQKGAVDGAFIPWEIIPPLKIQDQTQFQIEGADMARFGTTTFQVSMNKSRWENLPEDIQKAFKDASGRDWWGEVGEIWRASDDFGIGLAVNAGNSHIVLSPEETAAFKAALEPVVDRWIGEVAEKGIDGAALVAKARKLIVQNSQ